MTGSKWLGRRIKIVLSFICCVSTNTAISDNHTLKLLDQPCTQGSLTQIQNHFIENDTLIIARGLTEHRQRVLFLVSYPIDLFHVVTLNALGRSYYEACIESSGREVDYRETNSPAPHLFTRTYRAHQIFNTDIPKIKCESEQILCSFWPTQANPNNTIILSAYQLKDDSSNRAYDEIVKLKIGQHVISPSRGRLTQLARTKYSLRIGNQLDESTSDIETGKKIYREIHEKFDHGLALLTFSHNNYHDWKVEKIDRDTGHISILKEGKQLEMYPLSRTTYSAFSPN